MDSVGLALLPSLLEHMTVLSLGGEHLLKCSVLGNIVDQCALIVKWFLYYNKNF